jgi:hypothetical protein
MSRSNESTDGPDLSRVPVEALADELRKRGFLVAIVAKADERGPGLAGAPAIESVYTEVLAQELERRGWECFPPDA